MANGRSGSISVVDTAARRVLSEHNVGRNLADLASLPDDRYLLALASAENAVVLLDRQDGSLRTITSLQVGPDPVRMLISRDGSLCFVASRWPRRLTVLELTPASSSVPHPSLRIARTVELPFSPRELIELPGGADLLAADAFGGKLALVDGRSGSLRSVRSLQAHNIRGMALAPDGKTLVIAHQTLNPLARSTFDDIHWGLLVNHHLCVLGLEAVQKPDADLQAACRLFDLGDVGNAAGDPSSLAIGFKDNLVVALGGVNEVAITPRPGGPVRRMAVGRHPVALASSALGKTIYVANRLDDTVSVIESNGQGRPATISLGPAGELSLADRGERLFHDARLSHDGWMSCQSCHTDGHTNGLLSDTLGDGSFGAPKKIPSLLGVGATAPWTWTGSISRLEDQVRKSIQTTMHGRETASNDDHVRALTAYLRSLQPLSPALTDAPGSADPSVSRGRNVFLDHKCDGCHVSPAYTSPQRFDVDLTDEVGNREFNPPSLLGVSRRGPFLHDGRATTLNDLFQRHRHPRGAMMTPREIDDLTAFLKSL